MSEDEMDAAEKAVADAGQSSALQVRDIMDMSLDLTKDEKLRATALAMAVSYHKETIVKDGQLYHEMKSAGTNFRQTAPVQVIDAALVFEGYLRGEYSEFVTQMVLGVQHALADAMEMAHPTPENVQP